MSATPPTPPRRLWGQPSWLLAHVSTDAYRLVVQALGSPAVRTDYAVLAGLAECGPIVQADLGRRLGIDRSDMVAVLNRLEEQGCAARSTDPANRRRNLLTLTNEGEATLQRLDERIGDAQALVLAPLDASEQRELVELLQRLVEHHRGYERADPEAGV
ncbi:MAG: MarR family transcriptional regulator [Nocardioidaceae bacterium]|nr:MarR family transcriptional regulator [Nocardioidaceae bacterium]